MFWLSIECLIDFVLTHVIRHISDAVYYEYTEKTPLWSSSSTPLSCTMCQCLRSHLFAALAGIILWMAINLFYIHHGIHSTLVILSAFPSKSRAYLLDSWNFNANGFCFSHITKCLPELNVISRNSKMARAFFMKNAIKVKAKRWDWWKTPFCKDGSKISCRNAYFSIPVCISLRKGFSFTGYLFVLNSGNKRFSCETLKCPEIYCAALNTQNGISVEKLIFET